MKEQFFVHEQDGWFYIAVKMDPSEPVRGGDLGVGPLDESEVLRFKSREEAEAEVIARNGE